MPVMSPGSQVRQRMLLESCLALLGMKGGLFGKFTDLTFIALLG